MAPRKTKKTAEPPDEDPPKKLGVLIRVRNWIARVLAGVAAVYLFLIFAFSFLTPPMNIYQAQEAWRLGSIDKTWVHWDQIAPVMGRSVVAAEDANFCLHWGFDMAAIRDAIEAGSNRGASTVTQQVVKNVFLWHGRSWLRKAMEAGLTPLVELLWSKQRILEVYLNTAEFAEGVFGVQAASLHYFGIGAADLTATQAARLAAVLPDPQGRDANNMTSFMRKRINTILSGAETIAVDGRAACFE